MPKCHSKICQYDNLNGKSSRPVGNVYKSFLSAEPTLTFSFPFLFLQLSFISPFVYNIILLLSSHPSLLYPVFLVISPSFSCLLSLAPFLPYPTSSSCCITPAISVAMQHSVSYKFDNILVLDYYLSAAV